MIPIAEALKLFLSNLPERHVEPIDFRSALGRVLAENLVATSDIPPFRRAAVDGCALRFEDAGAAAGVCGGDPGGRRNLDSSGPDGDGGYHDRSARARGRRRRPDGGTQSAFRGRPGGRDSQPRAAWRRY